MDSTKDSSSEDELFVVQNINPSGQLNNNESQSSDTNDLKSQSEMTSAPSPLQTPPAEDEADNPVHKSEELPVENERVENGLPQQENQCPTCIRQPPDRFAYYAPGHAVVNAVLMNINTIPQYLLQVLVMQPALMQIHFRQQLPVMSPLYRQLILSTFVLNRPMSYFVPR